MNRFVWMLILVVLSGCHITEKRQKVVLTTKTDPFQIPDQSKTSVTVTYECSW